MKTLYSTVTSRPSFVAADRKGITPRLRLILSPAETSSSIGIQFNIKFHLKNIYVNGLGSNDTIVDDGFIVYPNPIALGDVLTLKYPSGETLSNITLINSLSQSLKVDWSIKGNEVSIDIAQQLVGLHTVVITTSNKHITKKIMGL